MTYDFLDYFDSLNRTLGCGFCLQKSDTGLFAGFNGSMIPDAGLDFADMGAAHHQHSQTALTNTTTDGQGKFVLQEHLVEG